MSDEKYQRIWRTTLKVPKGNVVSYGQIADLAGLPGRSRMIGKALGFAPEELCVPWFRVIRSSGHIAFAPGSDTAQRQIGLLQEEGVVVLKHRVKMRDFQWQPDLAEILMQLDY